MNLALPVSTYLAFMSGQPSSWKAAQWLQVIEAYSTIVAGASAAPSTMSGSGLRRGEGGDHRAETAAAVSARAAGREERECGQGRKAGEATGGHGHSGGLRDAEALAGPAARGAMRRRRLCNGGAPV